MSKFGLQSLGSFINSAVIDKNNVVTCQPRLFLSPSGTFIIRLNQLCNHQIYRTDNYERFPSNITYKFVSAAFQADDRYLYYVTPLRLVQYDLKNMLELTIINAPINSSNMNSLSFSYDDQSLYFLNFSSIYRVNLTSADFSSSIAIKNTQNCNISYFKLEPGSPSLVTSSPYCYLCKWSEVNGKYQLSKELNLTNISPSCQINQLFFKEGSMFLTKRYNVQNKVQIFEINFETFTLNQTIIRNMRYVNQWSYVVQVQNYLLTYIGGMSTVWINKDMLSNLSDTYNLSYFSFVRHAVYNPHKAELYHLMQEISTSGTENYIDRAQLNFNCSLASNTAANSFPMSTQCECSSKQVFNRSSAKCEISSCGYKDGPACVCPSHFTFNTFSQNCRLDCSTFNNSFFTFPFGSSSQCYCRYGYKWLDTKSGCVINCSQISNAFGSGMNGTCECGTGFEWSDVQQKCRASLTPNVPPPQVMPIIGPVLPDPSPITNHTQNPVGLTLLFIVLSLILVIIYAVLYYKKIKQRVDGKPDNQKEPKIEADDIHDANTDRPLPKTLNNNFPTATSEQYLTSPHTKQKQQKESEAPEADQNLQNFSIDEQDRGPQDLQNHGQQMFSQIQSNLQSPLK